MSVRPEVLALILACSAVTVVPRVLPMALARRFVLPEALAAWLDYVPVSVIAALFVDQVLLTGAEGTIAFSAPHLLGAAAALAVGATSRSIALTVVAGVAVFAIAGFVLQG